MASISNRLRAPYTGLRQGSELESQLLRNVSRSLVSRPTCGGFDHAILLCQRDMGDRIEICLPKRFFDTYADSMSKAKNQMKFNIAVEEVGTS